MSFSNFFKLSPMTSFVIEYYSNEGYADLQTLQLMINYAQFLKKKLTLDMFVAIDENGDVMKIPKNYASWNSLDRNNSKDRTHIMDDDHSFEQYKNYKNAEKKCFFKGFELAYNGYAVVRIVASYNHSIELSFNKTDLLSQSFKDIESVADLEIY